MMQPAPETMGLVLNHTSVGLPDAEAGVGSTGQEAAMAPDRASTSLRPSPVLPQADLIIQPMGE